MIVTAWILLAVFGWAAIVNSANYFIGAGLKGLPNIIIWLLSVVITALSAGVIWGGLFQ